MASERERERKRERKKKRKKERKKEKKKRKNFALLSIEHELREINEEDGIAKSASLKAMKYFLLRPSSMFAKKKMLFFATAFISIFYRKTFFQHMIFLSTVEPAPTDRLLQMLILYLFPLFSFIS